MKGHAKTTAKTAVKDERGIPLSRVVTASLKKYAAANAEHDRGSDVLRGYIPGPGTFDAVARLDLGMRGSKHGRAISVTGPYGSGKSTMAVFLDALYAPSGSAEWKKSHGILRVAAPELASSVRKTRGSVNAHERGFVRCIATAGREPVAATVVRALECGARQYFGHGRSFDGASDLAKTKRALDSGKMPSTEAILGAIRGMCAKAPVLVVIDEFGKNIEYFTDEQRGEGDLFLLQAMAEMSGGSNRIPLFIVTLQHMAFEEYATGASSAQRSEWAKVQGRFDDLPFSNSPEQTRLLVAGALERPSSRYSTEISRWAKKHAAVALDAGLGPDINEDLLFACYPLHPLVLEVLPEMCSRYGQNERTLLSFVAGGGSHTVARFIDETTWSKPDELPSAGLDLLYDYFVAGSALAHAASSNVSRLMEISTIIRDARDLSEEESRALKAVGVLNLLGKSGRLRASRNMIRYATGASSDAALQSLEEKSIVSYRRHADEYRVWHGSDADIKAALEIARRRWADASLADMLNKFMPLNPVVAARHSRETGTVRVFERRFADPRQGAVAEPTEGYDGAIMYFTGDHERLSAKPRRPVLAVKPSRLEPLRESTIEAASIRDVLDNKPEITSDWVARKELNERLVVSESAMARGFDEAFGDESSWRRIGSPGKSSKGNVSEEASKACDNVYSDAPRVFNVIINRAAPSGQGMGAVNRLLGAMVNKAGEIRLGITGWGPERAIYEALLAKTGIHRGKKLVLGFYRPNKQVTKLWDRLESMLTKRRRRVAVSDLYATASEPPFGARAGIMPVLTAALILANRDSMALYEHGTYCPTVTAEALERMAKNPSHFEIKYFGSTKSNRPALERIARELGIATKPGRGEVTVLDVVGFLVTTISKLAPCIKNTKMLGKDASRVRDAVLEAVEPDSLLFEALPEALGFPAMQDMQMRKLDEFAVRLAKSVKSLETAFGRMLEELGASLFDGLGADKREEISKLALGLIRHVSEPRTRAFLNAVSADSLDYEEWIKYVAMSLSGMPPADWSDNDRLAFDGNLKDMSGRFVDLAALHFGEMGTQKHSFQVTLTRADGRVERNVVAPPTKKKIAMDEIASVIVKDMKRRGFGSKDVLAIAALMISKSGG